MGNEGFSKRQLLKIMAGTGLLVPGLPACLSHAGVSGLGQQIENESRPYAKPTRLPDAALRTTGQEAVLYLQDGERDLLKINEIALETWRMCDGRHSIPDMAAVLSSRFNRPYKQCLDDISATLRLFHQYGLVSLQ